MVKRKGKEKVAEEVEAKRGVAYWIKELDDARKREKDFRKGSQDVVAIYESERSDTSPYNILYSNTEILYSALYNTTPRPLTKRRFNDKDPVGSLASQLINRFLEYFMDSNDRDYSNFDEMMKSALKEALVPGRGLTKFKYEAEFTGESEERVVSYETVCGEEVPWDRVYFGYAKRWSKLPWIAFEHFMDEEELEANFGHEWASVIPLAVTEKEGAGNVEEGTVPKDLGKGTLARVYEVWDKYEKVVVFFSPDYHEKVIKEVGDPLELSGFYPIPRPLYFGQKISSLLPIPLYTYYEEQAKELNRITIRINNIVKALKVRGFYDSSLEGIAKVLEAGDNELLPAENTAAMRDGQTLDRAIWLMPLEKLITVLQQLYAQREVVKGIIQELSGIADIMRGASKASETLGAQELKNQWGGLRLNTLRKEVQRYVRDCLRIAAEIGFKQLSQSTIAAITGVDFPTMEEKMMLQQQVNQQKMMIQQQAAMAQQAGQEFKPPPPPPPEVVKRLQSPTWEEVLELCKSNIQRNYKIDIETDSTFEANNAEEKKDVGEFLNALAQFMNGAMPLVQGGILPFEVMKSVLLAVTRKYKFGVEIEESISNMQPPPPPSDPKGEGDKAVAAADAQKAQLELQAMVKEFEMKLMMQEKEAGLKEEELNTKLRELVRKDQLAEANFASRLKQLQMKNVEAAAKAASTEEGKADASV